MGPQSVPSKSSDNASPPPNSATTSGSTSTATTIAPLSPGDQTKHLDSSPEFPNPHHGSHQTEASTDIAAGSADPAVPQSPGGRYNPSAYPSAIKILVSNNVAGSIIGRSGQTISELQTQSSARIKLSQTGDFYPGTQDRVCLVQGQLPHVKTAVRLLLERLYMLQEQQFSQHLAWKPVDVDAASPGFDFVVRLLVPSSSCGMIIGKAGSNIKHMEETAGVSSVRLSPKESSDPTSPSAAVVSGTAERIVTLTGSTMESCLLCTNIVLDGMMAHHDICRYSNMTTSYSRVVIPGSFNAMPQSSRPVLMVPSAPSNPEQSLWEPAVPYNQFGGKRSSSSPDLTVPIMWDQQAAPRMQGHPEAASGPMSRQPPRDAIQPYNPMFGDVPSSYPQDMPGLIQSGARGPPPSVNTNPLYLMPAPSAGSQVDQSNLPSSASAPDLLAMQLQDSMRISNPASSVDYTHFAPQLPQPTPPGFTAQVLVPDTLIGSILGRGGRTLTELQMHSNTRIRISQRGEYVPGTRNRIVTIRGPTAHSVSLAQYLMSQRMVLPPTASYSSPSQFVAPQMQQRNLQQPLQYPQHAQRRHDPQMSQYHQGHHEGGLQGPNVLSQHPPHVD